MAYIPPPAWPRPPGTPTPAPPGLGSVIAIGSAVAIGCAFVAGVFGGITGIQSAWAAIPLGNPVPGGPAQPGFGPGGTTDHD